MFARCQLVPQHVVLRADADIGAQPVHVAPIPGKHVATVDDDGTARGGEGASYATDRGRLTRPVVPQHL